VKTSEKENSGLQGWQHGVLAGGGREAEEGGEAMEETSECCQRSPERKERRQGLGAVRGQDGGAGRGGLDQGRMQACRGVPGW